MEVWLFGNMLTLSSARDPTLRVSNPLRPNLMTTKILEKDLNGTLANPLTSSGTSLNSSGGGLQRPKIRYTINSTFWSTRANQSTNKEEYHSKGPTSDIVIIKNNYSHYGLQHDLKIEEIKFMDLESQDSNRPNGPPWLLDHPIKLQRLQEE